MKPKGLTPWKWAFAALAVALLVAAWFFLPVKEWSETFQQWVEGLGPWGWLMFAAVYIVATVLLVPVSVLTIVAGVAFGLAIGFPLVVSRKSRLLAQLTFWMAGSQ